MMDRGCWAWGALGSSRFELGPVLQRESRGVPREGRSRPDKAPGVREIDREARGALAAHCFLGAGAEFECDVVHGARTFNLGIDAVREAGLVADARTDAARAAGQGTLELRGDLLGIQRDPAAGIERRAPPGARFTGRRSRSGRPRARCAWRRAESGPHVRGPAD